MLKKKLITYLFAASSVLALLNGVSSKAMAMKPMKHAKIKIKQSKKRRGSLSAKLGGGGLELEGISELQHYKYEGMGLRVSAGGDGDDDAPAPKKEPKSPSSGSSVSSDPKSLNLLPLDDGTKAKTSRLMEESNSSLNKRLSEMSKLFEEGISLFSASESNNIASQTDYLKDMDEPLPPFPDEDFSIFYKTSSDFDSFTHSETDSEDSLAQIRAGETLEAVPKSPSISQGAFKSSIQHMQQAGSPRPSSISHAASFDTQALPLVKSQIKPVDGSTISSTPFIDILQKGNVETFSKQGDLTEIGILSGDATELSKPYGTLKATVAKGEISIVEPISRETTIVPETFVAKKKKKKKKNVKTAKKTQTLTTYETMRLQRSNAKPKIAQQFDKDGNLLTKNQIRNQAQESFEPKADIDLEQAEKIIPQITEQEITPEEADAAKAKERIRTRTSKRGAVILEKDEDDIAYEHVQKELNARKQLEQKKADLTERLNKLTETSNYSLKPDEWHIHQKWLKAEQAQALKAGDIESLQTAVDNIEQRERLTKEFYSLINKELTKAAPSLEEGSGFDIDKYEEYEKLKAQLVQNKMKFLSYESNNALAYEIQSLKEPTQSAKVPVQKIDEAENSADISGTDPVMVIEDTTPEVKPINFDNSDKEVLIQNMQEDDEIINSSSANRSDESISDIPEEGEVGSSKIVNKLGKFFAGQSNNMMSEQQNLAKSIAPELLKLRQDLLADEDNEDIPDMGSEPAIVTKEVVSEKPLGDLSNPENYLTGTLLNEHLLKEKIKHYEKSLNNVEKNLNLKKQQLEALKLNPSEDDGWGDEEGVTSDEQRAQQELEGLEQAQSALKNQIESGRKELKKWELKNQIKKAEPLEEEDNDLEDSINSEHDDKQIAELDKALLGMQERLSEDAYSKIKQIVEKRLEGFSSLDENTVSDEVQKIIEALNESGQEEDESGNEDNDDQLIIGKEAESAPKPLVPLIPIVKTEIVETVNHQENNKETVTAIAPANIEQNLDQTQTAIAQLIDQGPPPSKTTATETIIIPSAEVEINPQNLSSTSHNPMVSISADKASTDPSQLTTNTYAVEATNLPDTVITLSSLKPSNSSNLDPDFPPQQEPEEAIDIISSSFATFPTHTGVLKTINKEQLSRHEAPAVATEIGLLNDSDVSLSTTAGVLKKVGKGAPEVFSLQRNLTDSAIFAAITEPISIDTSPQSQAKAQGQAEIQKIEVEGPAPTANQSNAAAEYPDNNSIATSLTGPAGYQAFDVSYAQYPKMLTAEVKPESDDEDNVLEIDNEQILVKKVSSLAEVYTVHTTPQPQIAKMVSEQLTVNGSDEVEAQQQVQTSNPEKIKKMKEYFDKPEAKPVMVELIAGEEEQPQEYQIQPEIGKIDYTTHSLVKKAAPAKEIANLHAPITMDTPVVEIATVQNGNDLTQDQVQPQAQGQDQQDSQSQPDQAQPQAQTTVIVSPASSEKISTTTVNTPLETSHNLTDPLNALNTVIAEDIDLVEKTESIDINLAAQKSNTIAAASNDPFNTLNLINTLKDAKIKLSEVEGADDDNIVKNWSNIEKATAYVASTQNLTPEEVIKEQGKSASRSSSVFSAKVANNLVSGTIAERLSDVDSKFFTSAAPEKALGMAAGGEEAPATNRGVWVSKLTGTQKQGTINHVAGYQGKNSGFIIGVDTSFGNKDSNVLGVAYGEIHSDFELSKGRKGDKVGADSRVFSVYGQTEIADNLLLQGSGSLIKSNITSQSSKLVSTNTSKIATGKFKSTHYGLNSFLTYKINKDNFTLLPSVGLKYGETTEGAYNETGTGVHNLAVSAKSNKALSGVAGFKAIVPKNLSKDTSISTAVHASVEKQLGSREKTATAKLQWASQGLEKNIKASGSEKISYNVGSSLLVKHKNIEVQTSYNYHFKKNYSSHQGAIKLEIKF